MELHHFFEFLALPLSSNMCTIVSVCYTLPLLLAWAST